MANSAGGELVAFDIFDSMPPHLKAVMRYAPRSFSPPSVWMAVDENLSDIDQVRAMIRTLKGRYEGWIPPSELIHEVYIATGVKP